VGVCGTSLAPLLSRTSLLSIQKWRTLSGINSDWTTFAEFASVLSSRGLGCNVASLVGYATLRRGLVGDAVRTLDNSELESLKQIVRKSLEEGAFGLSSGLSYAHEVGISSLELNELAKVVREYDGLYSVHLRSEGTEILESLQEALEIAQASGCKLKLSHLKIRGTIHHYKHEQVLSTIETAYHRGVRVHFDVYPYHTTWQPLYSYLPKWVIEGGRNLMVRQLADPIIRRRVLDFLYSTGLVFSRLIIASTANQLQITGKTLGTIAGDWDVSSEEALLQLVQNGGSEVLVFDPSLDDLQVSKFIHHPLAMIASDGAGFSAGKPTNGAYKDKLVHPRCFGAAPRFLHQVIQDKTIPIESAVRKLTGLPAQSLGLQKRGLIAVGNFADIVLFDPHAINSKADYYNPFQYAEGISYVFVNGELALASGAEVSMHGRFLSAGAE
jgi:N-acyl-D-amino-acid deacylase